MAMGALQQVKVRGEHVSPQECRKKRIARIRRSPAIARANVNTHQLRRAEHNKTHLATKSWVERVQRAMAAAGIGAIALAMCVPPADAARSGGRAGGKASAGAPSTGIASGGFGSFGGTGSAASSASSGFGKSSMGGVGAPAISPGRSGVSAPATAVAASHSCMHHHHESSLAGVGAGFSDGWSTAPRFMFGSPIIAPAPLHDFFDFIIWLLFMSSAVALIASFARNLLPTNDNATYASKPITVTAVQVGLLGSARWLQRELTQIAESADTQTQQGLKSLLQDAALTLLRNPEFCVYGRIQSSKHKQLDEAERVFDEYSLTEQSKYREETLANTGGQTKRSDGRGRQEGDAPNEYICVTLLVASAARVDVPSSLSSLQELQQALRGMASLPSESIKAAEIVWTPQQDEDTLTQEELLQSYPSLTML